MDINVRPVMTRPSTAMNASENPLTSENVLRIHNRQKMVDKRIRVINYHSAAMFSCKNLTRLSMQGDFSSIYHHSIITPQGTITTDHKINGGALIDLTPRT